MSKISESAQLNRKPSKSVKNGISRGGSKYVKELNQTRISIMLVVICILVLVAELPQAVLIFISIFNNKFYLYVYKPLGDLMDICVIVNYSINFILYCSMSSVFRKHFCLVFK